MFWIRSAFVLLLALPAITEAAPVPAGPVPKQLEELPVAADSMLVAQLNGIERTKERLSKMLSGVGDEFAKSTVKKLDEALKEVLDGRDLKSIDGNGRVFVAVGDLAKLGQEDPPYAICLPVADYKAFREKFLTAGERRSSEIGKNGVDQFEAANTERTTYLVNKNGYVVWTPNKTLAEQYAGKLDYLKLKSLGRTGEALLELDVSVFLNLEQINAAYGDQIKQGRQLINLLLQQGGQGFDKQQLEVAKEMLQALFQLVEDGRGFAFGIDFRPEGPALRIDTRFAPDSDTGKFTAAEKPTPLAAVGELPKGMLVYSATKWKLNLSKLSPEFTAAPDEDKSADSILEYTKLLSEGGTDTISANANLKTGMTLRTVANADKLSASLLKVMKGLTAGASYSNILLKGRPEITEAAEKYKGFTLNKAVLKMDFDATAEKIGNEVQKEAAIASMKRLMPEKVTQWFGTDGKRFLTVTATDWTEAKALLDGALEQKLKAETDPMFKATRKQLPTLAGSIMLIDAAKGLSFAGEYLEALGGAIPDLPVPLPKFGKVKSDPVYVGFAMGLSGDSARIDLFVPISVVKLVRQAIADE